MSSNISNDLNTIGRFTLLVREYTEALDFFVDKLGFAILADIDVGVDEEGEATRYVHIGTPGDPPVGLWLWRANTPAQRALIGQQLPDMVCGVIYTKDFQTTHDRWQQAGVHFLADPQVGEGEQFVHFHDLYGNRFVLVELATAG